MTEKVKGNQKRLITVPGYHIHPQYDLKHLRALIYSRHHGKKHFSLTLAPMVDMFSILVIYLLMNFSTNGDVFFIGKDITIPISSKGREMTSLPLVSVANNKVFFELQDEKTKQTISYFEPQSEDLPKLRQVLRYYQALHRKIKPNEPFAGQINLQADYSEKTAGLKKIMQVLIEEGWTGINFIVDPDE